MFVEKTVKRIHIYTIHITSMKTLQDVKKMIELRTVWIRVIRSCPLMRDVNYRGSRGNISPFYQFTSFFEGFIRFEPWMPLSSMFLKNVGRGAGRMGGWSGLAGSGQI